MGELVSGCCCGDDDGDDARIRLLVDWARRHGAALHPAVDVYRDARTGLSFRVRPGGAPLPAHAPVVRLPTALTLSYLDALADAGPCPLPPRLLARAPPHVVGRLFLAKELLRGRDSFWWPYLQALPPPADREAWALPPFWPPDEAELLDGTNVEVGVAKMRADVGRELRDARRLLRLDADGAGLDAALTTTLYHWAYCVFSSRSFRPGLVLSAAQRARLPPGVSLDDFSVLLPLFDIGNHDMTADVRWELDDAARCCELRVGRAHAPGEQVFNNYSLKTNAELLLGYGFLLPATDELHNDYTHVRKRSAAAPVAADEYLISLRPVAHASSLLARAKQAARGPPLLGPPLLDPATEVLGAFQHVQPDMVWDIFGTLAPPGRREHLIPAPGRTGDDADRHRRAMLLSGRVAGEGRVYLEQTVALIQHKVLQELERLDETDVDVVGGDAELLTRNQKLALDYRGRCRRVLETTLEAMGADGILNDPGEEP